MVEWRPGIFSSELVASEARNCRAGRYGGWRSSGSASKGSVAAGEPGERGGGGAVTCR